MLHLSDIYFGLTSLQARELAYTFACTLGIHVPQIWKNNERAGRDWFLSFMRRHPRLSMRLPEATRMARASSFNRSNVELFFNNLDTIAKNIVYEPQNIWNIDETGLQTVHEPQKVVGCKGRKQVGSITSSERGQTVSMAVRVNAAGMRAPPYLVFPRVRFAPKLLKGGPPGCWGGATNSGFMNGEKFFDFIQKFRKYLRCSRENLFCC